MVILIPENKRILFSTRFIDKRRKFYIWSNSILIQNYLTIHIYVMNPSLSSFDILHSPNLPPREDQFILFGSKCTKICNFTRYGLSYKICEIIRLYQSSIFFCPIPLVVCYWIPFCKFLRTNCKVVLQH